MKKLFLIFSVVIMAGCTTVPVTMKFPDPPETETAKPCVPLKKLNDQAELSDVAKTVFGNYTEYHLCSLKVDTWIEWYTKQKAIYERLK